MKYIIYESALTSSIENPKSNGDIVEFITVLQEADAKNRNGRIYPKSVIEEGLKGPMIQEKLARHSLFGEAGHPYSQEVSRQTQVDLRNAAFRIEEFWWEGNLLKARCRTLDTALGRDMAGLIKEGCELSFSMRGQGNVTRDPYRDALVVKSPLMIITYDWVYLPSHDKAYMESICEETKASMFNTHAYSDMSLALNESCNLYENGSLVALNEKEEKVEKPMKDYFSNYRKSYKLLEESYQYDPKDQVKEMTNAYVILENDNEFKKVAKEDYLLKNIRSTLKNENLLTSESLGLTEDCEIDETLKNEVINFLMEEFENEDLNEEVLNEGKILNKIRWKLALFSLRFLTKKSLTDFLVAYYSDKDGKPTKKSKEWETKSKREKYKKVRELANSLPEDVKNKVIASNAAQQAEKVAVKSGITAAVAGVTAGVSYGLSQKAKSDAANASNAAAQDETIAMNGTSNSDIKVSADGTVTGAVEGSGTLGVDNNPKGFANAEGEMTEDKYNNIDNHEYMVTANKNKDYTGADQQTEYKDYYKFADIDATRLANSGEYRFYTHPTITEYALSPDADPNFVKELKKVASQLGYSPDQYIILNARKNGGKWHYQLAPASKGAFSGKGTIDGTTSLTGTGTSSGTFSGNGSVQNSHAGSLLNIFSSILVSLSGVLFGFMWASIITAGISTARGLRSWHKSNTIRRDEVLDYLKNHKENDPLTVNENFYKYYIWDEPILESCCDIAPLDVMYSTEKLTDKDEHPSETDLKEIEHTQEIGNDVKPVIVEDTMDEAMPEPSNPLHKELEDSGLDQDGVAVPTESEEKTEKSEDSEKNLKEEFISFYNMISEETGLSDKSEILERALSYKQYMTEDCARLFEIMNKKGDN